MGVEKFFELAHRQWPVLTGPIVTGTHNITMGLDGRLTVAIYLSDVAKWQTFYVSEDEFDDPDNLVLQMNESIGTLRSSHQKKRTTGAESHAC
jgi:hypothetical protein